MRPPEQMQLSFALWTLPLVAQLIERRWFVALGSRPASHVAIHALSSPVDALSTGGDTTRPQPAGCLVHGDLTIRTHATRHGQWR